MWLARSSRITHVTSAIPDILGKQHEIEKLSSIDRQVLDLSRINDGAFLRAAGFDERYIRRDVHVLSYSCQFERKIERCVLSYRQQHPRLFEARKAGNFGSEFIETRR